MNKALLLQLFMLVKPSGSAGRVDPQNSIHLELVAQVTRPELGGKRARRADPNLSVGMSEEEFVIYLEKLTKEA